MITEQRCPYCSQEFKHDPDCPRRRNGAPKYPDVQVQLVGEDGNPFAIIGRVRQALQRAGYKAAVPAFTDEATSGDYDHLLQICVRYVDVL
jgi:hypothetical protein